MKKIYLTLILIGEKLKSMNKYQKLVSLLSQRNNDKNTLKLDLTQMMIYLWENIRNT